MKPTVPFRYDPSMFATAPAVAYLCLVRPGERHPGLSRPHCCSYLLDLCRVALRLGDLLARQPVQVNSSLCCTDRGCHRSRFFAGRADRYVVFSAVGAVDLCCPSCRCIAHKPVPNASLFSVVAAFVCCPGGRTYAAHQRCHSCDVLSAAGARLFRSEGGLTNR